MCEKCVYAVSFMASEGKKFRAYERDLINGSFLTEIAVKDLLILLGLTLGCNSGSADSKPAVLLPRGCFMQWPGVIWKDCEVARLIRKHINNV